MLISQLLDVNLLKQHIDNGLISVQQHPELPLEIYNYTPYAQIYGTWGDGTIDYCRGLIVDKQGNVIARPYKKFHNLNTASIPETMEANLPNVQPLVLEKLDGSLGILYQYGEYVGIATRGSFTSPQAKWATNWLRAKREPIPFSFMVWPEGWTPLFEIIYDENRIVCKYDFETCILTGMVNIRTGAEMGYEELWKWAKANGVRVVQRYSKSLSEVATENEAGREGYVLTYSRGSSCPPVKVKVKFEDYVRLHRIVTGVNPRAVWELMSEGKDDQIRVWINDETMPEHFRAWLTEWRDKLDHEYHRILETAHEVYINRPVHNGDTRLHRKACAFHFNQPESRQYASICFQMLDGGDPTATIWKMIRPNCTKDESFRRDGE